MLRLRQLVVPEKTTGKVERLTIHNGTAGLLSAMAKLRGRKWALRFCRRVFPAAGQSLEFPPSVIRADRPKRKFRRINRWQIDLG